jgi:hypothetical protein
MFNLGYFKAQPTEWVRQYVGGRVAREGAGLTFFYWKHNSQLVSVPVNSQDVPFVFNEMTNNFQAVTLQGQATYRIAEPRRTVELLNFTIEPRNHRHLSEDPNKVALRVTSVLQMETRVEIQKRTLEETLVQTEAIASTVLTRLREDTRLAALGVEILGLFLVSAKPTPEVARALEATYREALLRQADEAIYARRASAVEEERKIKENELSTDITLEQQRSQLIALAGENALQEAELRSQALEKEAAAEARGLELRLAAYGKLDPRAVTGLALQEIGKNSSGVGNLTITTELLGALLDAKVGASN